MPQSKGADPVTSRPGFAAMLDRIAALPPRNSSRARRAGIHDAARFAVFGVSGGVYAELIYREQDVHNNTQHVTQCFTPRLPNNES